MKTLFISLSDISEVKKLEGIQRTFRKGQHVLREDQKPRLHENWGKVREQLKKEKAQRKEILSKIKTIRAQIKQLYKNRPKNYRNKVRGLKLSANKLAMQWYGKPLYISVLSQEERMKHSKNKNSVKSPAPASSTPPASLQQKRLATPAANDISFKNSKSPFGQGQGQARPAGFFGKIRYLFG